MARERRERMRVQLLDAVLQVYPGDPARGPAVIDDVVQAARVSRGTFYKYFTSVEQAAAELGARLADDLAANFGVMFESLENPLHRAATAFQLMLTRASFDAKWGLYVAHINHLKAENRLLYHLTADLEHGIADGVFSVGSVAVAVDFVIGAMIEGMKTLGDANVPVDYIPAMATMVLRGLGAAPLATDQAVQDARSRLVLHSPSLTWWPDTGTGGPTPTL